MHQARLRVRRQALAVDASAAAEGRKPTLDVEECRRGGAILQVSFCCLRKAGDAARDRSLIKPGGSVRGARHGLSVGIDWQQARVEPRIRHQQFIEVQRAPQVRLPRALERAHLPDAGRHCGRGLLSFREDRRDRLWGRLFLDGHYELVFPDSQQISAAQLAGDVLTERLFVLVDVHAVGAQVLEEVLPVATGNARMARRNVAQRIRQHPVVLGGAPNGGAGGAEHDAAAVAEQPPMITDNA